MGWVKKGTVKKIFYTELLLFLCMIIIRLICNQDSNFIIVQLSRWFSFLMRGFDYENQLILT